MIGELAQSAGANAIFWNRRYEPAITQRDRHVKEQLRKTGLDVASFNGALLHEPWTIQNKAGKPFQVFTPYWKTCLSVGEPAKPVPAPDKIMAPNPWPSTLKIDDLCLQSTIPWADGIRTAWTPGSAGARAELDRFLNKSLLAYDNDRNRPDVNGTSRLSPHLHFGEIGPRQVWNTVREYAEKHRIEEKTWRHWQYMTEIGWREFAHHLLYHFPHTPEKTAPVQIRIFSVADGSGNAQGMAKGGNRLSPGRCGHAAAMDYRLDAQ